MGKGTAQVLEAQKGVTIAAIKAQLSKVTKARPFEYGLAPIPTEKASGTVPRPFMKDHKLMEDCSLIVTISEDVLPPDDFTLEVAHKLLDDLTAGFESEAFQGAP